MTRRDSITRPSPQHPRDNDDATCCAVIWNLSKRADNALGLVQPNLFDALFSLLIRGDEEGDVLRRVVSCIQNLASMRRLVREAMADVLSTKVLVLTIVRWACKVPF